jgi:hypothetical protein
VLYGYSLSQKGANFDEDEGGSNPIMTEIALHRVVLALMGQIIRVMMIPQMHPDNTATTRWSAISVMIVPWAGSSCSLTTSLCYTAIPFLRRGRISMKTKAALINSPPSEKGNSRIAQRGCK